MHYTPNNINDWAARIHFADDVRGPKANVSGIEAEFIPKTASRETMFFYLDNGYGIYTEAALNSLIKDLGLVIDQAACGEGFAAFRNPNTMNF